MSLAKPDVIDLVAELPGEKEVALIAFDDGVLPEGVTREQALQKKLTGYLQFVSSGQFSDTYPEYADVGVCITITVVCMAPPSAEMQQIKGIRDHGRQESFLPVVVTSDTEFRANLRKHSTASKPWWKVWS